MVGARLLVCRLNQLTPNPHPYQQNQTHERKLERLAAQREEAAGALAASKAVLAEREKEVCLYVSAKDAIV